MFFTSELGKGFIISDEEEVCYILFKDGGWSSKYLQEFKKRQMWGEGVSKKFLI